MNDTDARLWHPSLRINRVLRVMLHTRWSAEAWPQVKAEFVKALAPPAREKDMSLKDDSGGFTTT
jgi:hypothetical protein